MCDHHGDGFYVEAVNLFGEAAGDAAAEPVRRRAAGGWRAARLGR
jgi:hypothetical protein